jgi:hypothetical protein
MRGNVLAGAKLRYSLRLFFFSRSLSNTTRFQHVTIKETQRYAALRKIIATQKSCRRLAGNWDVRRFFRCCHYNRLIVKNIHSCPLSSLSPCRCRPSVVITPGHARHQIGKDSRARIYLSGSIGPKDCCSIR